MIQSTDVHSYLFFVWTYDKYNHIYGCFLWVVPADVKTKAEVRDRKHVRTDSGS